MTRVPDFPWLNGLSIEELKRVKGSMLITYNLEIYSKVLYVFKLDKYWSKGAFLYNLSNNNVQRSNDTLIGCLLTNSCVKNRNMTKYNNKNSIFWSWWMQSHWSPIKWPITPLPFNIQSFWMGSGWEWKHILGPESDCPALSFGN